MKVSVYHTTFNELTGQKNGLELVAEIAFDDGSDVEDVLEKAWRRTNNLNGSWSMGPYFDVAEEDYSQYPDGYDKNTDYHASVTVKRPLHVRGGKTYGLRSSMVGDMFVINDTDAFVVADFGFDKIEISEVLNACATA